MKILLVDDHAIVREGIKHLLKRFDSNATIIEAENGSQTIKIVEEHVDLDLILLDFILPDMSGLEVMKAIQNKVPSIPIVVLSIKEDSDTVKNVLDAGAKGFIPKTTSSDVMFGALQLVFSGGVYVPQVLISAMEQDGIGAREENVTDNKDTKLTKRQHDVLRLLVKGLTNKEIGLELKLSEATVRTHLSAIFRTLKVRNRVQAGNVARQLGLILGTDSSL